MTLLEKKKKAITRRSEVYEHAQVSIAVMLRIFEV
jgi:hypothetical protein